MYAKAVKELRRRRGWSQTQLAAAAGMKKQEISLIEKGIRLKREPVIIRLIRAGYAGGSVKVWRERHGWCRKELAWRIGATPEAICQIEKGRRVPKASTVFRLMRLGMDIGVPRRRIPREFLGRA